MMQTTDIILHLCELAREAEAKSPILDQEHGTELGVFLFGNSEQERQRENRFSAARRIRRKFDEFLNTIPDADIETIVILMYFGRDPDEYDYDIQKLHDATYRTAQDARRAIKEKMGALPTYLPRALQYAAKLGLDIDGSLFKRH